MKQALETILRLFNSPNVWINLFLALVVYAFGYAALRYGFLFIGAFGTVLPLLILIYTLYQRPSLAPLILFLSAYLNMGVTRYFPAPLGTVIDGLLGLSWFILILKGASEGLQWRRANRLITWLALIWFAYLVLQLFNPEVPSRVSWVFSARGMGGYLVLTAPLTLLVFYKYQDWNRLFMFWGVLTLLAFLRAMIQKHIGFDPYEIRWLNEGNARTHLLLTGTRYFSFFTDAGQFGATMAQSGIVFLIMAIHEKVWMRRIFFVVVSMAGFWAMGMSGTRGAIAVPAVGLMLYVLLSKNLKYILFGLLVLAGSTVFFKYTYIGQSVYEIRRMRSAFAPKQDASMNVRLENQKKFAVYLQDKPFGAGLGTSSANGNRFYPGSFLASIATDSWYVQIWVENGIIGLSLYLGVMVLLLARGAYISLFLIRDRRVNQMLRALMSGAAGVLVASYANAVIGQFPSSVIFAISMSFPFVAQEMDRELSSGKNADKQNPEKWSGFRLLA